MLLQQPELTNTGDEGRRKGQRQTLSCNAGPIKTSGDPMGSSGAGVVHQSHLQIQ